MHLPSRMHRPEENRVINSEVKRIGYQVGFLSVGNCLQRNPVSSDRERYVWYRAFKGTCIAQSRSRIAA